MTASIRISTVMLCWNRVELSKKVLAAYLDTISVRHELIIVDNASTDETAAWLNSIKKTQEISAVERKNINDPGQALNDALQKTRGEFLMVLENDYLMLPGWDEYALTCFHSLPGLGQLSICTPAAFMIAPEHNDLVKLAKKNVVTSSIFPRHVFFEKKVRFLTRNFGRARVPDDSNFSQQIRALGLKVAWPARNMAISMGFDRREYARDPNYYLHYYCARILDKTFWRYLGVEIVHLNFYPVRLLSRRVFTLLRLYLYRIRGPRSGARRLL